MRDLPIGIHQRDEVIPYIYIYAVVCVANVNNLLTKEAPVGVEGRHVLRQAPSPGGVHENNNSSQLASGGYQG